MHKNRVQHMYKLKSVHQGRCQASLNRYHPDFVAASNGRRLVTIGQPGRGQFCHTAAMATKTIPEYLEDERRSSEDTQLRTDEEADRIQLLHQGHHRTRKQPKPELPAPVEVEVKAKKPAVAKARKPAAAKTTKPAGAARRKPPTARKPGTKARRKA
jgi:hypothetical protein